MQKERMQRRRRRQRMRMQSVGITRSRLRFAGSGGGAAAHYPGSLVCQNFGEAHPGHGYLVWDVGRGAAGGAPYVRVEGRDVPILWGLAYANVACMTGVVYRREFLWAGLAIFAGAGLAMAFTTWSGLILGPFMGLGMILPGRRAEKSVTDVEQELS